ncbi:MAG: 30S ribosomal protein S6 [Clostridia bacterium]|nr:30S ribosomal protein S6 [Clostridia bacterium]
MSAKSYETMVVFSVANGDEAVQALIEKFKAMIEAEGTLESIDEWGKRKLAYPINDEPEGYYAIYYYTAEPEFPAEIDRVFKITDGVLRSLIIAKETNETKETSETNETEENN